MLKQVAELRALFLILMAAAGISFVLCLVSDVRMSITHTSLPDELTVAAALLVGHGLRAGLLVILPLTYLLWQRSLPGVAEQS